MIIQNWSLILTGIESEEKYNVTMGFFVFLHNKPLSYLLFFLEFPKGLFRDYSVVVIAWNKTERLDTIEQL